MTILKTYNVWITFDRENIQSAARSVKKLLKKEYYIVKEQQPTENENTGYYELSKQTFKTK